MKLSSKHIRIFLFIFLIFISFDRHFNVYAADKQVVLRDAVNIRKGPGTNYSSYGLSRNGAIYTLKNENVIPDEPQNGACRAGWYEINYNDKSAYVCASYASIKGETNNEDVFGRPWTSPKKAIVGGAKFITSSYINKGQFTAYLKKFNVNPNSSYSVYNHQYMANLGAPSTEANRSYKTYKANGLLNMPLEFTIPTYENMPSYTQLPGKDVVSVCESNILDQDFENKLNEQGFSEDYKCKLRELHKAHPNWTFKILKTGLDFERSITAEQSVSSIQGGGIYYASPLVQTEPGWYKANRETVGYYLDPRNFLIEDRILMFENLGYSENYTEKVVAAVLKGTFMDDISILDNEPYSQIFVEAGRQENVSAVYLASLAVQEAGVKVSNTTNGAEFTYEGITYAGLYNFFNIGAYSSAKNPALAGLVYASGGSSSVIINNPNNPSESNGDNTIPSLLGAQEKFGCLQLTDIGTTIGTIKSKLSGYTVSINAGDGDIIKTGQEITINKDDKSYKYIIVVSGDVDGDGKLGASDYVKIKNYIMEKSGSELNTSQSLAADADGDGGIKASDYVRIKNKIMER